MIVAAALNVTGTSPSVILDAKSDDARLITGVGYDWQAIQLGEATYTFPAVSRDTVEVTLYTLPFWPLYQGKSNAISITVDDTEPQVFENLFAEYSRTWVTQWCYMPSAFRC